MINGMIYKVGRYTNETGALEINIPLGYGMVTNPENLKIEQKDKVI
jgi:hypothetical protein